MSTIRFPGLQTGIDTETLIAQLMAVERRTLNTWEDRKSVWEERRDALSTLESKLRNLRTAVRALSNADELRSFSTATSDEDKVTADATSSAFEGNHTVVINQLATAERWVHSLGSEYAENYVGAGTFIYSYNNKETSVTTTTTTTLQGLVGLINNDADNPGVTASLLYHNDAYHLVLNGNNAGTDYSISINAGNTEVRQAESAFTVSNDNATLNSAIKDLDQFTAGTWKGDEKIIISGVDHNGNSISGELAVNENTKLSHLISEINDAFDGRAVARLENSEIILTDKTCGTSKMELTLTYDPGSGTTDLSTPVISQSTQGGPIPDNLAGYTQSGFIKTQAAQDSKIKVDGYPPTAATAEVQTITPAVAPASGTYTLTYNGQTTDDIDYNATASEIQSALKALSNVSTDDITVAGGDYGLASGAITFTFLDTAGDVSLISINPAGLDQSENSNYTIAETTKGSDGYISRSSNTIDNVISGVALHLHDTTDANGEEITLTRDIQSVKDKLNTMIEAYNEAIAHIKETTGYDDVTKTAGALMGDYVVSTISNRFRQPIIAQTAGFIEDFDTYLTPGNIGIDIDADGMLSLDSTKFDEAIAEDYLGVLALIGADKTGSSTSNSIRFYDASDYTTAGGYDVQVEFDAGGNTTAVRIKLSTESTYRDMNYSNGYATGISTLNDNGDPDYAECGLQLTVPTTGTPSSTTSATVRIKQGFTGKIEDALDRMLKATVGSIIVDQDHVKDQIDLLDDKIEDEEYRLEKRENRLILQFARLEGILAAIQSQMSSAGVLSTL